uniref:Uncharacterized protein n=1 Tax=Tanacetum cinerariifolium TaxID=118510 RepID=A0A6L2LZ08_TANCI|nr:hypothetical protein [Tanacetum cinerariifolium]
MPAAILTPDDNAARSDWWISSKAYFDGFIGQVERVPFDLSRQNMYEITFDIYREFDEEKREIKRNKNEDDNIKEEMCKFRQKMNVQPPGSYYSFGQVPSYMRRPNLQTTIETHHDVDGILTRKQFPSKYKLTTFMEQPPTTILPKQRVNKTKNKGKTANLSPLNLEGAFEDDNIEDNNIMFLGSKFTVNFLMYENVGPTKEDRVRQLTMMKLAHEFNDASTAKYELGKAYEKCKDIPLEQRDLIEIFLKTKAELDYQMNNALLLKAAKLESKSEIKLLGYNKFS